MKRALVTGGSGGIGAAICRRLAADGHHVIVHANRSLDKAAAVISAINGQAIKSSFNFQGPWAVLHLIDTGSPSYQDNGRIIKLKWSFPDGALTAEIRPSSMNHPFIPNVLGKFNCPDNL